MEQNNQKDTALELGAELMPDATGESPAARECWQRFMRTGSVLDYLTYTACFREDSAPFDLK